MKAAIILNGLALETEIREDFIICADGGYRLLKDRTPDCVIGDFDSLGFLPQDAKIIRHPAEKNYTDGELCVRWAAENGYNEISIYAALGGRIDHVYSNLSLLALAGGLKINAVIREKNLNIYYAKGIFELDAQEGDVISVLPFGGAATVTDSEGLYYPLKDLPLLPEGSRGMSNRAVAKKIRLNIIKGQALVVHYHGQKND